MSNQNHTHQCSFSFPSPHTLALQIDQSSEETGHRKEPQKISFSTMSSGARLLVLDFALSFMWLWSGVLVKIFVFGILGFGNDLITEFVKTVVSILNMFFFAFLVKISKGAAYNPLSILSAAFSGDFSSFLFTVGARIPAQVLFPFHFVYL